MPDFGIAGVNGINPMYNNYINQTALNGIYDNDLYSSNPMMGMNGSVFGGGFMPTFGGGMNYDAYFNNMKSYLNFTSDYQMQAVQNQRNNDIRLNASTEGIQNAASVLNEKISANEQEQIQGALKSYIEAVAAQFPNESKELIVSRAKTMYKQAYGVSLSDDVRAKGSNSFKQGLYQVLTLGLADNRTAEENIAEISNQPVNRSAQTEKVLGRTVGGFVLGGGSVLAMSQIKALKHLKGNWAIIGAIAGAAIAGFTTMISGARGPQET